LSSDSSATITSKAELVPADCFAPLNLSAIYGRDRPLVVDLGCGDGAFLAKVATENPNDNFLGVERLLGRVRTACRKIERTGLTNVRIMRFEISYAVERLLPVESVAAFYILFPDPWPKRRHAPRRLITQSFLLSLHRALRPDGTVRIATDQSEYFHQIIRIVAQSPHFSVTEDVPSPAGTSQFEKRFVQAGLAIHRLALRKVSPVT
jgi:tRNA (guanine-N7-)-methyltransferase